MKFVNLTPHDIADGIPIYARLGNAIDKTLLAPAI
jgi:hypothetical protein